MDKIIIIRWDTQLGPQPIIQYPPAKEMPKKDLFVKIWAKYELQKEKSIIILTTEDVDKKDKNYLTVTQQYEGELYFFILEFERLQKDQNFEDYSEILGSISKNLIELIHSDKFMRALSEGYNQIKGFVKLEKEQNIINIFKDKIKTHILKVLEKGVISKAELINKLKENYGFSGENIDLLLSSFLKEGLILKKDLPGIKECIFLVKDLVCIRIPPNLTTLNLGRKKIAGKKLKASFKRFYKDYVKKLEVFFTNFDIISENKDNTLYALFFNENIYNLIKSLRETNIPVEEALMILEDKQELFDDLLDKTIILERKGILYLFSDIRFVSFLPIFILKNLKERYDNLEITSDQYVTHIEILLNELNKEKKEIYTII